MEIFATRRHQPLLQTRHDDRAHLLSFPRQAWIIVYLPRRLPRLFLRLPLLIITTCHRRTWSVVVLLVDQMRRHRHYRIVTSVTEHGRHLSVSRNNSSSRCRRTAAISKESCARRHSSRNWEALSQSCALLQQMRAPPVLRHLPVAHRLHLAAYLRR
jgi:hypothetical protein